MNRPMYTPARASQRTVAFETLGCKLNQYETDSIATELGRRGFSVVDGRTAANGSPAADAYVINTCTVTNKADRKSRNTVNRARRHTGSAGVVVVTGCFVDSRRRRNGENAPEERAVVRRDAEVTTYVVDNAHKNTIPELLEAHFRGEVVDPNELDPNVFGFAPPGRVFHTRTNIKVQDGCDNFCSFCIIPFVRGRAASRRPEEILTEAREAIRGGTRELVLTGVNMSRYHARWYGEASEPEAPESKTPASDVSVSDIPAENAENAVDFVTLVEALLALDGEFRLRISSLEPDGLDQRFVNLFRHPKMCPHLHLCLQSGSDRTLLRMRRMYTVAQYLDVVERLRAIDPDFTITTDLIVGFPGEDEEAFQASLRVVDQAKVSHVHMFPFSVRHGTRAERMADQVDPVERSRRGESVMRAAIDRKRAVRSRFVGQDVTVLVERAAEGSLAVDASNASPGSNASPRSGGSGGFGAYGLCEYYHPVHIVDAGEPPRENNFYRVRIHALEDGNDPALIGHLVS